MSDAIGGDIANFKLDEDGNSIKIFRGSPCYYEKIERFVFDENSLSFLSLNLPPICNYHCAFCFAAKTLSNHKFLGEMKQKMLTHEEYSRIIGDAKNLGVKHLEISGEGEPDFPLFRPTLKHIIQEATKHGIHTTMFANGSWIDDEMITILTENDTSLVISIKYFSSEKYDRFVSVPGAFAKVQQSLEIIKNKFSTTYKQAGLQIYNFAIFSAVLLDDNLEDNEQLRKYCDANSIFFGLSTLIPHGGLEGLKVDFAAQDNIVRKLAHNSMILADSSKSTLGFPVCGTFYYGLGINYDGEIVFDAHANETAGQIGNIRQATLEQLVEQQHKLRDAFFRQGATSYCPLRDANYNTFSKNIKNILSKKI